MGLIQRQLVAGVLQVVRRPWHALGLATALLLACVAFSLSKLSISTDQNKLFDPTVPFFRDYLEFERQFPENEAVYVLVEAKDKKNPPPVPRWTAVADALLDRLKRQTDTVKSVYGRIPIQALGRQGLLFEDPSKLQSNVDELRRFIPLVKLWAEPPTTLTRLLGPTPLDRFLSGLAVQPADADTASFLKLLADSWTRTLQRPSVALPDLTALDASDPSRLGYYYIRDESDPSSHLLLVHVHPKVDRSSLTAISEVVESIRAAAAEAAKPFPEFTVGVTGRPALEADEMSTTDRDSNRAEVAALAAVFVGMAIMLRSLWLALAAEIALGVAIGWTFGWATLAVGELNLLSIVFLIALIGIGMDYLVQILMRYRQEAEKGRAPRNVWARVFRHVGPPINTACLGAAGAFLVAVLTRFQGAADLGVIAGGGLLLCLLSGYVVLPAILTLWPGKFAPRDSRKEIERAASVSERFLANKDQPLASARGAPKTRTPSWRFLITPLIWIALLAAGVPFMLKAKFDPGLLNLQDPTGPAVQLIHKLQTWSAVVLTKDLDVLRRARAAVESSPLVANTESILQAYDNAERLTRLSADLPKINWTEPTPVSAADLPRLADKAKRLAEHFAPYEATAAALNGFANQVAEPSLPPSVLRGRAGEGADREQPLNLPTTTLTSAPTPPSPGAPREGEIAEALSGWQRGFVAQLRELISQLQPGEPNVAQLPIELSAHYVGASGVYALHILPKNDLWKQSELEAFVKDVEARLAAVPGAPKPTGIAINIYHSTRSIERAFHRATAYAVALILLLVWIDLRSPTQTLLAVSVLAFGLPMLVAVMGLFGVSWNFANFFGLPILIGAAHEYGVFMVHRYREAKHHPTRAWTGWDVADRALLLCVYITSGSFAFFWGFANHRGLKSLGLVMAVGAACVYLATLLVLRPLLLWKLERQRAMAMPLRNSHSVHRDARERARASE